MTDDSKRPFHDRHQICKFDVCLQYIGTTAEWWPLLAAFEKLRREEILGNAEALYLLSDLALHRQERLPAARTGRIVLDWSPEEGVFMDVALLDSLAAGCRELLVMASSDRLGALRGSVCDGWPPRHGQVPLLNDDEDRAVRSFGNRIIGLLDDYTGQPRKGGSQPLDGL